jgi:hypothetical protein
MIRLITLLIVMFCGLQSQAQVKDKGLSSEAKKCRLLLEALKEDSKWLDARKDENKGVFVIANHGFDFTCLKGVRGFRLVSKADALTEKDVYFIFSINQSEEGLVVELVRQLQGNPQPLEKITFSKISR